MKFFLTIVLAAGVPAFAQSVQRTAAPAAPVAAASVAAQRPALDREAIAKLEGSFEDKLKSLTGDQTMPLLGACSGVYLRDYGVVFILPIELTPIPPVVSPFGPARTPADIEKIRARKLANVQVFKKTAQQMLTQIASSLTGLPAGQKVAVAARFFYYNFENRTGLPSQITISADRASAMAGQFLTEEQ